MKRPAKKRPAQARPILSQQAVPLTEAFDIGQPDTPVTTATLYRNLGHAIADLIRHPKCPTPIFRALQEFTSSLHELVDECPDKHRQNLIEMQARFLTPICLELIDDANPEN